MQGLNERDMQAVVNSYDLNDFYFPTLFPLKEHYTLNWKTLQTTVGLHIAADLVARGASLDAKTRDIIRRLEGDIPKIGIERKKDENELNEYDIMVAMTSGNPDLKALVDAWAEDTKYCWTGVASRIEWMALYQISHAGVLQVTSENNAHVVTEYNADYQIPADQKVGTSVAWTNPSTAKPVSVDLKNAVKNARAKHFRPKFAFMNQETFNNMVETEEVQKVCASYAANALNVQQIPGLAEVNAAFAKLPYLYGLQVVIIDQEITMEFSDGSRTTVNPFATNVVCLTENQVLGTTFYKTPIDMKLQGTAAIKVMNGPTCIKKFANEEPVEEVTQGVANAFPAWAGSERTWHIDTKNATWQAGA